MRRSGNVIRRAGCAELAGGFSALILDAVRIGDYHPVLAEVIREMMEDAGARPDELHGLQHDLAIVHAERGDGIVRVERRVQARTREDDPIAFARRGKPQELVVRSLGLLRCAGKVILVQHDKAWRRGAHC